MSYWNNNYNTWNYRKISKNSSRYSAGILPYTYNQQGQCLFLLGKDYEGDWSDFGGKCEFKDSNEPENTACREFYEETLGAVIDITDCSEKIIHGKPIKIISKTFVLHIKL
jgi:predicted NUDIX family NTP pyrophosphohydrolase